MLEDITGTTDDGREVPFGTPEGNALWRAAVEEGLAGIEDENRRAYHARGWSAAWALRRDEMGILENPESFYMERMGRQCKPSLRGSPMLDHEWRSSYGFADDLDNLKEYLRPFIEHPTRRFLVLYQIHHPHVRTGTGTGMVVAAANGESVSCAIRWRKNGPYVGSAIPDPEEHGPEYVCDVPDKTFLRFHVYEWDYPEEKP